MICRKNVLVGKSEYVTKTAFVRKRKNRLVEKNESVENNALVGKLNL